jgi:hypothetical protein
VTSSASATTHYNGGAGTPIAFSSVNTWIYANLTIDVGPNAANTYPVDEGLTGQARFGIETMGIEKAQDVTATIELAPPMRLLSLAPDDTQAGWTCVLLTPQSGRCTGSFPLGGFPNEVVNMSYTFMSDMAGNGEGTITANAAGDGDPTNNVAHVTMPIRPFLDVAVTGSTQGRTLVAGQTTTIDATITTGKNAVSGVRVEPLANNAHLAIDSVTVGGVDCPQTQPGSPCSLGDLPANSSIPVRATFHAVSGVGDAYAVLSVYPDDSNRANNQLAVPIYTLDTADVQLSLDQTSVSGVNGSGLRFPLITVHNGAAYSRDITVDIPLPSFVSVFSVSSSGICTGRDTMQCTFASLQPNDSATIDIAMTATATGSFTSNVAMHAINDSTAGNNSGTVIVNVTAATSGGDGGSNGGESAGSSGGGGGGRIEWLVLALLGGLALRRGCGVRVLRR